MSAATLWVKHRPQARRIAADYHLPGAERQDVEQEALIGLWAAAHDWNPGGGASFRTFADIVIRRRLQSCVKMANAGKHRPLNAALREAVNDDGDVDAITDLLPHLHQIADVAESRDLLTRLLTMIRDDLTPFQQRCVIGVAAGMPYLELGPPKAVDNALYKARRKLSLLTKETA